MILILNPFYKIITFKADAPHNWSYWKIVRNKFTWEDDRKARITQVNSIYEKKTKGKDMKQIVIKMDKRKVVDEVIRSQSEQSNKKIGKKHVWKRKNQGKEMKRNY